MCIAVSIRYALYVHYCGYVLCLVCIDNSRVPCMYWHALYVLCIDMPCIDMRCMYWQQSCALYVLTCLVCIDMPCMYWYALYAFWHALYVLTTVVRLVCADMPCMYWHAVYVLTCLVCIDMPCMNWQQSCALHVLTCLVCIDMPCMYWQQSCALSCTVWHSLHVIALQLLNTHIHTHMHTHQAVTAKPIAGALHDNHRAVIMGDTNTYGKGRIQTVFPLQVHP